MPSVAIALPIMPGKTGEWKELVTQVTGTRRDELDDFHRRLGLARAGWYLNQTPRGDIFILFMEGEDPLRAFAEWVNSSHPFDVWFKSRLEPLYGISFADPPAGPPPTMYYEYKAVGERIPE